MRFHTRITTGHHHHHVIKTPTWITEVKKYTSVLPSHSLSLSMGIIQLKPICWLLWAKECMSLKDPRVLRQGSRWHNTQSSSPQQRNHGLLLKTLHPQSLDTTTDGFPMTTLTDSKFQNINKKNFKW